MHPDPFMAFGMVRQMVAGLFSVAIYATGDSHRARAAWPKEETDMPRQDHVAMALAAGGPRAEYSPVQVQKLLFLIDRKVPQHFGGEQFNFTPYHYGPFDSDVYQVLEAMASEGLVAIRGAGSYRRYSLTEAGHQLGEQELQRHPGVSGFLIDLAAWVRSLRFEQLVASVYNDYPEMRANSVFRQ